MTAQGRRKLAAEAFGTFCLVFAGTGAVVINEVSGGTVSHVGVALTFGLVVLAMVYALVNNAGVMFTKPVAEVGEDEFDRLFAVNVKGAFFCCQEAAKRMAGGGRIINLSSSTTALMLPGYAAYVATKGAVEQFSHVLAKELGPKGITVNVVSPGPVDTELFGQGKTEEQKQQFARAAALGRLGQPEDIADVVAMLAGEDARWVTGQNIRANGGLI